HVLEPRGEGHGTLWLCPKCIPAPSFVRNPTNGARVYFLARNEGGGTWGAAHAQSRRHRLLDSSARDSSQLRTPSRLRNRSRSTPTHVQSRSRQNGWALSNRAIAEGPLRRPRASNANASRCARRATQNAKVGGNGNPPCHCPLFGRVMNGTGTPGSSSHQAARLSSRAAFVRHSTCGWRISSKARSHNRSGLHSPVFASAMILFAIACLTSSAQSPIRRPMQTCSNATPRTRNGSWSNCSRFKKGLIGIRGSASSQAGARSVSQPPTPASVHGR